MELHEGPQLYKATLNGAQTKPPYRRLLSTCKFPRESPKMELCGATLHEASWNTSNRTSWSSTKDHCKAPIYGALWYTLDELPEKHTQEDLCKPTYQEVHEASLVTSKEVILSETSQPPFKGWHMHTYTLMQHTYMHIQEEAQNALWSSEKRGWSYLQAFRCL